MTRHLSLNKPVPSISACVTLAKELLVYIRDASVWKTGLSYMLKVAHITWI